MTDLTVILAGMTLKNPVVVASGTFGFGREYGRFYDLSELGGICYDGTTLHEFGIVPTRAASASRG